MASPSVPEMDADTRRKMTQTMLGNIKRPATPPKGFDHMKASNAELISYGLPPRPDAKQYPKLSAMWEHMLSRPFTVEFPEFKINDTVHYPQAASDAKSQNTSGGNSQNSIWSGAVISPPPSGQKFYTITGAWVVPNAYPPPSARLSNGKFTDGTYQSWAWVGLDGWNTPAVLQGGTQSICTVSGGNITSQTAAFWIEWYPSNEITLSLKVSPGDMVQALVCGQSASTGTVQLINTSANTSTPTMTLNNPSAKGVALPLLGATAEWIMEDPSNASGAPVPFANYGSTFFYNTICASKNASGVGQELNLSNAFLLDMAQGGTVMATTVEENPTVFLTYAYGDIVSSIP